ncbi:MAG: LamB/YcsF family protein [Porticoccus sp.]|nr:LamB/YcsF family protein [Porticoccus sp.]
MTLLLNCDLGESANIDSKNVDASVMPFIDQASIACGFHAGDPDVMAQTLTYALENKVQIGAHPSYPDRENFGRLSMDLPYQQLIDMIKEQISALVNIGKSLGAEISYVKPHGALYNDMMANGHIRSAVMQAVSEHPESLAFMLQATQESDLHRQEANVFGLDLIFEVFADRCYADNGALLSRSLPGAVHTREKMLEQVKQLHEDGSITTVSGHHLALDAHSICVHGDNAEGVSAIQDIRQLLNR